MAIGASNESAADVVVMGAGPAGLTAGLVLAGNGYRVVCVDPKRPPRERVGESLDWSAPALLDRIGLPVEALVDDQIATWKREVHGLATSGLRMVGQPKGWMARRPLQLSLATAHIDRLRFDTVLFDLTAASGVRFVWQRVTGIDVEGDRVVGCRTGSADRLTGRWYIDASGRARLLARALEIDRRDSGATRVAVWAHRRFSQPVEGTVLHLDDGSGELRWAWEIPIQSNRQSVGVVIPDSDFQSRRRRLREPEKLLLDVLGDFPDISLPGQNGFDGAQVRAFRTYTHSRVSGANWMMIGEAATFVDPLTSTGVSAAMRHAIEAADVIQTATPRGTHRALRRFDRRLRAVSNLYNTAIEEMLYSPPLRRTIGLRWASRAYVVLGFGMSAVYARVGSRGPLRHGSIVAATAAYGLWLRGWLAAAAISTRRRHNTRQFWRARSSVASSGRNVE